ncbi:MAG TPA: NAD(P)H-dependent oxidoreductase [Steroidobacteraceae bacterium]|nr:NAD(P)H-dependent oxidoreductase [Steroidobacteraceae bacterium]
MKLLHIDSSILGENSASRTVSREIVASWQAAVPGIEVKHLDLAAQPLPHLSGGSLAQADAAEAARDAQAMGDFMAADVIVIGAPMYNFAIPSQLKAWIDRIVVAGKTFRYGAAGPEGLVKGKRVFVAISRGSVYAPGAQGEFAESYLRHVLGFIGVHDVTFVRAEGLGLSPEHRQKGISAALSAIEVPRPVAAAA